MPYIHEQKRLQTTQRAPLTNQRNYQRPVLSAIPRPVKQLVNDNKPAAISHASKPTRDTLPNPTPCKDPNRTRVQVQSDQTHMPTLESDPEVPILELVPFSSQPFVNFGDVKLGNAKVNYVVLRNSRNEQQQLVVKSLPKQDKGFNMDATEFIIAPHTEICVALAWTPKLIGGLRESITLQDVKKMSWRIVLMGNAVRPKPAQSVIRPTRNVSRFFRRSPPKVNKQIKQESKRALFSPRTTIIKSIKPAKQLTKLNDQSPTKRHQLVRNILSQYDQQMAIRVQSYCRMVLERRRLEHMKAVRKAVVVIQCYVRRFIAQRNYEKLRSAIMIQKHFRGLVVRREYHAKKKAVMIIQRQVRMSVMRRRYLDTIRATLVIQKYLKGFLVRRECEAKKRAAITIQRQIRMHLARRRYLDKISANVTIQKYLRGFLARRKYQAKRKAVIIIQRQVRMCLARKRYLDTICATLVVQKYVKGFLVRRKYEAKKRAAITIQKQIRMRLARRRYLDIISATVTIQKYLRGFLTRCEYHAKKRAAIIIQRQVRMRLARRRYLNTISAILTIQKHLKGFLTRREYQARRKAAILIQSRVRMLIVRRRYLSTIDAMSVLMENFKCLTGRLCTLSFRDEFTCKCKVDPCRQIIASSPR